MSHIVEEDGSSPSSGKTGPYLHVWSAAWKQAVDDFHKDWHNDLAHSEPISWFYSDERYPGSFVWLCELFGYDPDTSRHRILKRVISTPPEECQPEASSVAA